MSFGEPIHHHQRINVLIPENIKIEFVLSLSPGLLALLQALVDQGDDRRAALKLSADVKAQTDALAEALPPSTKP